MTPEQVEAIVVAYLEYDVPEDTIVGIAGTVHRCPIACALYQTLGTEWNVTNEYTRQRDTKMYVDLTPTLQNFVFLVDNNERIQENAYKVSLKIARECFEKARKITEGEVHNG